MSWLAVVYISSWSASAASLMNIHNVYRNNYLPVQFTPIVHSDNMFHLFLRLLSSHLVSETSIRTRLGLDVCYAALFSVTAKKLSRLCYCDSIK